MTHDETDRHDPDDGEPLFDSVDEMCAACGFHEATWERILRDIELTRLRDANDAVH